MNIDPNVGNLYAMYGVMKASMLAQPEWIDMYDGHRWRPDYEGWLLDKDNRVEDEEFCYWPAEYAAPGHGKCPSAVLATEFALLILQVLQEDPDDNPILRPDLIIRDCEEDKGSVPSSEKCEDGIYWVSPDIWVDIAPFTGAPDPNPEYGEENHLYARVRNIGTKTASDIVVNYYWADPTIGLTLDDGILINPSPIPIGDLEPSDQCSGYVEWWPPAPGHFSIFATAECEGDPIVDHRPQWDNNIGMKNMFVKDLRETDDFDTLQVTVDFKVKNPDTLVADVWLDLSLEDWPPAWTVELTSPDSQFVPINDTTYVFYSLGPGEKRDVTLTVLAPAGTENDTGTVHIAGRIDDRPIGGISVQIVPPKPSTVRIPNTVYERFGFGHWDYFPWNCVEPDCPNDNYIILDEKCEGYYGINPGDYFEIPIILEDPPVSDAGGIGAFHFEVEFDYVDLTFYGADRGGLLAQRMEEDGVTWSWEYFSYRLCPCAYPGCLKYKIELFGQAEMPDGLFRRGYCLASEPDTPEEWWYEDVTDEGDTIGATLVWLRFGVANNELLRDLKLPIEFEWDHKLCWDDTLEEYYICQDWDCAENTFGSCDGVDLYVSIDPLQFNPDVCGDEFQNPPLTILDFVDGGVHICSPCTSFKCVRGDVNLNHIAYDPADPVLLSRAIIFGDEVVFWELAEQRCASDVNADGRPVMLADLIYLIRVIQNDAIPYPKLGTSSDVANLIVADDRISVECASPIGGLLFEFDGAVTPTLLATDMELLYHEGRVLVWSRDGNSISAGVSEVLSVTGADLVSVIAVDRESRDLATTITTKVAPSAFALHNAYPNPFNPYTNLTFTLPNAVAYSMKIYNVAGQLVRSYEGMGIAGLNVVTWNGKDDAGKDVSSGVYFYRLVAGQYNAIKKMILLK